MRWIVRIVFMLVALLAVAFGALFLIPAERIFALVGDQFHSATGRTLVVSGTIRPSIYPALGLYAEGVEIGNPAWVGDGPMLRADRLDVGVALTGLFSGDIQVEQFELTNPQIILIKDADGAESWDFGSPETTAEQDQSTGQNTGQSSSLTGFGLDAAKITGGSILYRDLSTGTEFAATNLDITMHLPSLAGAADVNGNMTINGAVFSINASVDGIGPLLDGTARTTGVKLGWSGGSVDFSGLVGLSPMAIDGGLSFDSTDLGPLMSLAGQAAPDLPRGFGRDRLAVDGKFSLDADGAIHLGGMNVVFDDNRLSGNIDILPGGDRPMIRAQLQGQNLDFSGASQGQSSDAAPTAGWSQDHIDVSALHSVDADIALTLTGLDLGVLTLGPSDIHTTLSAGRMVVKLNKVAAYGGSIAGEYVVNGRGGLSMGGNLAARNIQLNPLLTEFAGIDRLEGNGSGNVKFLIVGNDMNTLMNSLSGSGAIEFGQGAILGLDIGGMITNLDTSYRGDGQKTVYDTISASFTMKDGVVHNDDLILTASFGKLTGSGVVGVGQQTLDYTVIPQTLAAQGSQNGLRVPLNISGRWSDPKFKLDLEALAEQELRDELDALEDRATDALTDALGLDPAEATTDGTPPPTLEEQLQSEAEKQLLKLLGGSD